MRKNVRDVKKDLMDEKRREVYVKTRTCKKDI